MARERYNVAECKTAEIDVAVVGVDVSVLQADPLGMLWR